MNPQHSCSYDLKVHPLPPTPLKKVFTSSTMRPVPVYRLAFNFTCKTIVQDWISHEYSTDLVRQHPSHTTTKSFDIILPRNIFQNRSLQTHIAMKLHQWPLPEPARRLLIKKVVRETIDGINSTKPRDNNFLVNVDFTYLWDRFFVLETFPKMVSATDESIESLERKKGTNYGSCSICLEDISNDCLAAKMPCSHEFHGDCIERWLKTSHYCPLCRYEMPKKLDYQVSSDLGV